MFRYHAYLFSNINNDRKVVNHLLNVLYNNPGSCYWLLSLGCILNILHTETDTKSIYVTGAIHETTIHLFNTSSPGHSDSLLPKPMMTLFSVAYMQE